MIFHQDESIFLDRRCLHSHSELLWSRRSVEKIFSKSIRFGYGWLSELNFSLLFVSVSFVGKCDASFTCYFPLISNSHFPRNILNMKISRILNRQKYNSFDENGNLSSIVVKMCHRCKFQIPTAYLDLFLLSSMLSFNKERRKEQSLKH